MTTHTEAPINREQQALGDDLVVASFDAAPVPQRGFRCAIGEVQCGLENIMIISDVMSSTSVF